MPGCPDPSNGWPTMLAGTAVHGIRSIRGSSVTLILGSGSGGVGSNWRPPQARLETVKLVLEPFTWTRRQLDRGMQDWVAAD